MTDHGGAHTERARFEHRPTRTAGARRGRVLLLAALIWAGSGAGCRFDGVPPPEPFHASLAGDAAFKTLAEGRGRLPLRLAVAPVTVGFDPVALFRGDATKHGAAPDAETIRRETIKALEASGLFERVEARGVAGASPDQVVDLAWSQHDDLLLELDIRSYYGEYLGHSNYLGWFLAYVTYVFPAFYIPVDYYGMGLEVHAKLRSIQSSEPILDETCVVRPREAVQELTPSDRELVGFLDLGALWNVEASLEEANWRAIDRSASPHAFRRFHRELLLALERQLGRPLREGSAAERENVLRKVRKRFAVVVGIAKYADPVIGATPNAASDANALATLLQTPRGGELVPGRNLSVLVDEKATRQGILDAVAAVASRASATDEVLVSISGLGATVPPSSEAVAAAGSATAVLIAQDTAAGRLAETGLSLEELGRALAMIRASRVAVLLDASFATAGPATRTFGRGNAQARVDAAGVLAQGAPGRAVICAARPDQAAHELGDADSGLFGYLVRAGLSGAASTENDGRVTLQELFAFVRTEVRSRAGLEGFEQEPIASGLDDVELAWPR